jgi:hypothetical protein
MSGPSVGNDPLSPNITPPPYRNSNREALRLETPSTQTKQSTDPHPNREKEAWFSAPVGEGVHHPPGLGLGVDWGLGRMRGSPDIQNSNREGRRLETDVNLTKQRIRVSSNREIEAVFDSLRRDLASRPSGPSMPFQAPNSNRDSNLLETYASA